LLLIVDLSASGVFGSTVQSKRELAGEIACVLAFSAIRNNDRVGLILFTEDVEKYIAPRKGERHVLRVIREILYFDPHQRGTNIDSTVEFLLRITSRKAIVVLISDFLTEFDTSILRHVNKKHDLVAIQIVDPNEMQLPDVGRIALEDAETGEIMEINTSDVGIRSAFARRREYWQDELKKNLRMLGIDLIKITNGQPYAGELEKFFKQREKRRFRG
ncbi:MAG TPA: VWA domain-containing protein, partial [Verrucomicrobiota bacterium]|nr:VWA domain-containing protein [Verrucomicrobiota bacterium]